MQELEKKLIYQQVIGAIKKTKEVIDFAHQIEAAILYGFIKPQDIPKTVLIGPENDVYCAERDWTKYEDDFKNDFANVLKIGTVSHHIIVLKESYAALFVKNNPYGLKFAEKTSEPDLWAAQEILRHIRHVLGHMSVDKIDPFARATWNFIDSNGKNNCPGKLEVVHIGVELDTTNLQGVAFNWNQIGGIKYFYKILDYLIEDLSNK